MPKNKERPNKREKRKPKGYRAWRQHVKRRSLQFCAWVMLGGDPSDFREIRENIHDERGRRIPRYKRRAERPSSRAMPAHDLSDTSEEETRKMRVWDAMVPEVPH
jgi:hypothetical protein